MGGQQQVDDTGRCVLHPGIQLQHHKKDGEWRVLLNACPLCVSGLPATGQSVSTPGSRRASQAEDEGGVHDAAVADQLRKELDKKVTKKKKSKSRSGSSGRSGSASRAGSSGRSRRSSATPPTARPRSPSPQSPHETKGAGEGNPVDSTVETSDSSASSMGMEYNAFLQYLEKGVEERQRTLEEDGDEQQMQQQQQQQHPAEVDQGHFNTSYCTPIESDYSAADTASNADTMSHTDSTSQGFHAEDEALDTEEGNMQQSSSDRFQHATPQQQQATAHQARVHSQNTIPQQYQNGMPQNSSANQAYQGQQRRQSRTPPPASTPPPRRHRTPPPASTPPPRRPSRTPPPASTPPRHRTPPPSKTPPRQRSKSPYNRRRTPPLPPKQDVPQMSPPSAMPQAPNRPDPEDTEAFNQSLNSLVIHEGMGHEGMRQDQHYHQQHMPPSGGYPIQQLQQQDQTFAPNSPQVLEQDDVSMMSMSSVVRNAQRQKQQGERMASIDDNDGHSDSTSSSSDSASEAGDSEPTKSQKSSDHHNGWGANTADYDERGYCRSHPTVRLRKKQLMRGWKVVLSNCPECCLDEMRRVKDERVKNRRKGSSGSKGDSKSRGSKSRGSKGSRKKKRKSKRNKYPPMSQVNLKGSTRDEHDDTRSVGTASTITISSYTHSTGGKWEKYASDSQSVGSGSRSVGSNGNDSSSGPSPPNTPDEQSLAKVTRMPYTDTYGEHGWYTGQVDAASGTPHGIGMMNYSNGDFYEGEWRDGVSITPSRAREEPMLGGPGGGFSSPRGMSRRLHRPPQRHPYPMATGGRSYLATLDEDGTSSDHEGGQGQQPQPDTPPPQPERAVVCGMFWTDVHGDAGVYTGEVNEMNLPHGIGSMRYDGGLVSEGMWNDGYMEDDDYSQGSDVGEDVEVMSGAGSLPARYSGYGDHASGSASVY